MLRRLAVALVVLAAIGWGLFAIPLVSSAELTDIVAKMALARADVCRKDVIKPAVFVLDETSLNKYKNKCGFDLLEELSKAEHLEISNNSLNVSSAFSYHAARLKLDGRFRCQVASAFCFAKMGVDLELFDIELRRPLPDQNGYLEKRITTGY